MAARRTFEPRKRPLQARSQATVDAILQAATYILVREGWQQFTTNRIAERAGVNIASLYQYFPNKEAIIAELQIRHSQQVRALAPRILPQLLQQRELRGVLRTIVEVVVQEHCLAPALHRVFAEELPKSARKPTAEDAPFRHWEEALRPFLKGIPNPDLAIFIARKTLHAAVHEGATERPEYLTTTLFVEEITTLLERYLDRTPRP
jgi:AcrR family transcriptional regulator